MFDISKIRADFPLLEEAKKVDKNFAYLDSGATSQKPLCVIEKEKEIYCSMNANIHRGVHRLSNLCTVAYEEARKTIAQLLGCDDDREIIFTSGATASINLVAYSYGSMILKKGDEVLVSEMEHHSNIVPWQLICEKNGAILRVIPFFDNGELDISSYEKLLNEKTKIVAITQCSNTLGTRNDVNYICKKAHEFGAKVVVDGCQGVVHQKTDVKAMDCDFYAFSGHKLYAPTGIGVLYGKKELLEIMPPFMGGGDMVAHVTFEKTTYAPVPLKFEAGTSNYVGAIVLAEAVKYVNSVGIENIMQHEKELIDYAMQEMSKIDDIIIYGTMPDKDCILSFNIKGVHPYDLGMILDKQGIAIRTGTHCAEPTMTHYGVKGMARASFAMYNTLEEVDKLVKATKVACNMLK
ncbi:MAG: cysteine desulfurase [Bacteroidetes bacterium]|nr:cysteine desulfurase [Bacteroidota bacterium]